MVLSPSMMPSLSRIDALSNYATLALTSPSKSEREAAASQLRFLSSFDAWESVKEMFPLVKNYYLLFVLGKAILFIVSNEIGPEERSETLEFMLRYLKSCHERGEELPRFVRVTIYSVLAGAFHSNWKFCIISSSAEDAETLNNEHDVAEDSVRQLLQKLEQSLPPLFVLECLTEIVSFFSQQSKKQNIFTVSLHASRMMLPLVLNQTAQVLPQFPVPALELSCLILQSIPDHNGALMSGGSRNIVLPCWHRWSEPIQVLMNYCFTVFSSGGSPEVTQHAGQFMELCAHVESSSEDFLKMSFTFSEHFINLADYLIFDSIHQNGLAVSAYQEERVSLAVSLLVSIVQRDSEHVLRFLDLYPEKFLAWSQHLHWILQQFIPEQEELHKSILNFYNLLDRSFVTEDSYPNVSRAIYPTSTGRRHNSAAAPYTPSTLLPDAVSNQLIVIFRTHLVNVVLYAHLKEDSLEVRSEVGVSLHNERMLEPLADLLFSRTNLFPIIEEKLEEILSFYNRFLRMRETLVSLNEAEMASFKWSHEDQSALDSFVGMSLAPRGTDLNFVHQQLSHNILVCLSRLSVIISIFAIAITSGRVENTESVLQYVSNFASPLLSSDENLTETLLENFSLNTSSSLHHQEAARQWSAGARMLHLGVIRSLFYFCNSIFNACSRETRHDLFNEITLSLLRFVYLHHSDEPALVSDANWLLLKSMSYIPSEKMLKSDKMLTVLYAIKEKKIPLLQHVVEDDTSSFTAPLFLSSSSGDVSGPKSSGETLRMARTRFLTAATAFIETRSYSGYTVMDVLEEMVQQQLEAESLMQFPMQCLENLLAITNGCRQPNTLQTVLDLVLDRSRDVASAIRRCIRKPTAARTIMSLCATASISASQLLTDNGLSYFTYELVNFVLNASVMIFHSFSSESSAESSEGGELAALRQFQFYNGVAEVEVVYDAFKVLNSICTSQWCKLGVLILYDRQLVESFLVGAVQVLLSTSVEMIMSSHNRQIIFKGLVETLHNTEDTLEFIFAAFQRQGVWEKLVVHMVRCLGYSYCPLLLALIHEMLKKNSRQELENMPPALSGAALRDIFREVIFIVVVSPLLEIIDLFHCFGTLSYCYQNAPQECTKLLTDLLDYCSAYHRVRVRCIQSQLVQGRQDMVEAYINIFGQSSKVNVLAPW